MDKTLYVAMAQHYYGLQTKRRNLQYSLREIQTALKLVDEELQDLNDILCKHGNHIYEHFEEGENG